MKTSITVFALVFAWAFGALPLLSLARDDDETLSISLLKSVSHRYIGSSSYPHASSMMQMSGDGHSVLCDGQEISEAATGKFECWGSFYWKYKNASSLMAAMCDGHFIYIPAPSSTKVVACEGLHHYFGKFQKTCPKTGDTVLKFYGTGCLGTSSSIMSSTTSQEENFASLYATIDTQLQSSGFRRSDPGLHHELKMLKTPPANTLNAYKGSVESRCDGEGGVMHGAKWGTSDKVEEEQDSEDTRLVYMGLRDVVESQLGPMAYEPLDPLHVHSPIKRPTVGGQRLEDALETPPASGNLISAMVMLARKGAPITTHISAASQNGALCEVTCNGRPAWFHGMWPCWGVLNVSCSKGEGSYIQSSSLLPASHITKAYNALITESEVKTGAPTTSAAAAARRFMITVSADGAAERSNAFKTGGSGSFSAACKGVWTGYLGKMCLGLTMQHMAASWPTGSMDNFWVCSGKLGVRMHEGPDYASSGHFCGGNEVSRMVYTKE